MVSPGCDEPPEAALTMPKESVPTFLFVGRLSANKRPDHAIEAFERVSEFTDNLATVAAAGIDSPLYWMAKGDRRADQAIRAAMRALGATTVHGTVQ